MDDIKKIIKGEVDTSSASLKTYSHDASIFEVTPQAVLHPKDVKDLRRIIEYVSERKLEGAPVSITARNAGTCMSGGSLTESYMVDMTRHFDRIKPIDLKGRDVWVQGGVMHRDVEKATHAHALLFAPYTSSKDICGIGGMLGNNASGEKSIKYGPTSKNIKRLKAVLSDGKEYEFGPLTPKQVEQKKTLPTFEGKLYREMTRLIDENWHLIDHAHPHTVKNAAGYPLWELWDEQKTRFNLGRLFIGAQGTLGIITEAELKLVPMAKASRMMVVPIETLQDLTPVVRTSLQFHPVTCETFDYHTYELAKKYYPKDAERANIADGQHMVVIVIFEGDSQAQADKITQQAQAAIEKLGFKAQWIDEQETAESFMLIRRKSFGMLLEHPHKGKRAMAFLEDTIIPLEFYGAFLAALESILEGYNMIYTYSGHIGDGSIRLIPLVNMEAKDAPDHIMELETKVNDLVIAFGGSISVDHNDGLIRSPYLEQFFGPEMYTLFAEVKELFDPLNIFNPGKKVGGSMEYTKAHIVRTNG